MKKIIRKIARKLEYEIPYIKGKTHYDVVPNEVLSPGVVIIEGEKPFRDGILPEIFVAVVDDYTSRNSQMLVRKVDKLLMDEVFCNYRLIPSICISAESKSRYVKVLRYKLRYEGFQERDDKQAGGGDTGNKGQNSGGSSGCGDTCPLRRFLYAGGEPIADDPWFRWHDNPF